MFGVTASKIFQITILKLRQTERLCDSSSIFYISHLSDGVQFFVISVFLLFILKCLGFTLNDAAVAPAVRKHIFAQCQD